MPTQPSLTCYLTRIRPTRPQPRTLVLVTLLLATVVMPVNYRAGADHAHAHTIFQGLIDLIAGHPHHHGDHHAGPQADTVSPFAPVGVPLSVLSVPEIDPERRELLTATPDAPELLGLSMPISAFAAIQGLGQAFTAPPSEASAPPAWAKPPHLASRTVGVEIPPPRPA